MLAEEHRFADLGISFNPPADCEAISQEMVGTILSNIEADDSLSLVPKFIFMNMQNSLTCFFSVYENDSASDQLMEDAMPELGIGDRDSVLNEGFFSHNDIDFHQIIIRKADFISIKLLFQNFNKALVVDYVVPFKYYEEELTAIESSIGTISKIKEEKKL